MFSHWSWSQEQLVLGSFSLHFPLCFLQVGVGVLSNNLMLGLHNLYAYFYYFIHWRWKLAWAFNYVVYHISVKCDSIGGIALQGELGVHDLLNVSCSSGGVNSGEWGLKMRQTRASYNSQLYSELQTSDMLRVKKSHLRKYAVTRISHTWQKHVTSTYGLRQLK